jgi:hypothetical protein
MLTLDAGGRAAVFAYVRGCWDFLEGPSGKARPAPLDPWLDVTGGFVVRDGRTHEALLGHLIVALRARQAAAPPGAKSPAAGASPARIARGEPDQEPGR